MRKLNVISGLVLAALTALAGCASGPCRQVRNPEMAGAAGGPQEQPAPGTSTESASSATALGSNVGKGVAATAPSPAPNQANKSAKPNQQNGGAVKGSNTTAREATVLVYKPDGSLQCGMGKAVPVEEMEKELSGIRIYSRQNRSDGMMHIQVCGSPTGMINVYEIPSASLKTAEARGFKKFENR